MCICWFIWVYYIPLYTGMGHIKMNKSIRPACPIVLYTLSPRHMALSLLCSTDITALQRTHNTPTKTIHVFHVLSCTTRGFQKTFTQVLAGVWTEELFQGLPEFTRFHRNSHYFSWRFVSFVTISIRSKMWLHVRWLRTCWHSLSVWITGCRNTVHSKKCTYNQTKHNLILHTKPPTCFG